MDCPRCGEENHSDADFCGYCGWAFISDWKICSTCNQTLKGYERCEVCAEESEEDAWVSNDLEDWYHLAEGT
jgi:predicted amidophosphoribosyltransferase